MKGALNIKNVIAFLAVILVWGYLMKTKLGWFDSDETFNTAFVDSAFFFFFVEIDFKKYFSTNCAISSYDMVPFLSKSAFLNHSVNSSSVI